MSGVWSTNVCLDAGELRAYMMREVAGNNFRRKSMDAASPTKGWTVEAKPGRSFELINPDRNLVKCDRRWAEANILHFFTGSEEAGALHKYNERAYTFLDGDRWIGAYGAAALPQLVRAVDRLRASPDSRRAVVVMPNAEDTVNSPACWLILQLLRVDNKLCMCVYQRSLGLGVFPYDCTLLTNVLMFAADTLCVPYGPLYWTVGSLHSEEVRLTQHVPYVSSLKLSHALLADPDACRRALEGGICASD